MARQPSAPRRITGSQPLPVQYSPLRKEDLQSEHGIAAFNQQMQQIVNALNTGNGVGGRVVLPHGVDVAGATVTGLGAPKHPTDAISASHAQDNYSAPVVGPQLDIGGPNALKGLTGLYLKVNSLENPNSTIASGYQALTAGLILQWGAIPAGGGTITFPEPFPTAVLSIQCTTTYNGSSSHYAQVLGTPSLTSFSVGISDADTTTTGYWIAVGY